MNYITLIWINPTFCTPPHGVDLLSPKHFNQVQDLYNYFIAYGFDQTRPALLGYFWENTIQLLSGSHRWLAAKYAGISLPVKLIPYSEVEACWGTEAWFDLMKDIPVIDCKLH